MKYLHQLGGLEGWQWVYLTQGLPAIILGMVVWAVLKNGPTPGLVERTGMPTTRREPAAVPVDRAQAHGARRADAGRPNARDMAAGHGDVPGAWRRLRLGFLVADPHQEPGRHEPGIDWRHRFGGERGRRRGAIVAGRRSDRCMNRHWYFLALTFIGAAGDELRACWRTLRAFDDGHRGHRPEPERRLALLAVVATDYLPGRSRRRASRSSPPSAFLAAPCSRPCLAI